MSQLTIGSGVLNQTPLDWEGNFLRIVALVEEAQKSSVKLLCLPELCLTGYGCEDQFLSPFTSQKAWEYTLKLKAYSKDIAFLVGLPLPFEGALYNVAACISGGEIVALIPKQHLADDGVHYEPRWFSPWPAGKRETHLGIPIGDYRIQIHEWILGVEICQDAWEGTRRPAHALADRGVSIICNPTASHFAFGKAKVRQQLSLEGAAICQGAYVFANLLGNESGRVIFDGDAYIVHDGQILAQNSRFSFQDHQLITAQIDLAPMYSSEVDVVIAKPFEIADSISKELTKSVEAWETNAECLKEEEFERVVRLGLWDYMRKSYSRGFVVSLSGGADSSAIVSLCFLALQAAEKELGFEGIKKRLAYIPWISAVTQVADLQKRLLTTLYQGTVNSSLQTRSSAKVLADGIGSTHYELEIDAIVGEYRELIEQAIGRALTWEQDDITLQNVQARVRSPSAWMLANINQALLLATSNRSEASVGYATMDGDTSGSISPIAGIDKSFLRTWLAWAEAKIPALHQVNSLEPSAELRPLATKQVDEEDLMPYPILNALERWAFYERKSPSECQEVLFLTYGAHFSKEKLSEFAHRFFRLWARNQWKRERYAPGFHVDEYSLDPKSWLRFPILSAGLEKDLPPV
jgi:NAD+ synthase (glutamine-hydrolysing)